MGPLQMTFCLFFVFPLLQFLPITEGNWSMRDNKLNPDFVALNTMHKHRFIRFWCLAAAIITCSVPSVFAVNIYWYINEVFSSANGSVQFVELTTPATGSGDSGTVGAYVLVNEKGQEFFFQNPNFGGSNSRMLLATSGFGNLSGAVSPDVSWLPSGFLSTGAGVLHLQPYGAVGGTYGGMFDSDVLSWSQLYINGIASIGHSGVNSSNSPENHAGQVGFVTVPEPSSLSILLCSFVYALRRKFRRALVSGNP